MNSFFLLKLKISGIKNIEKPIEIPFYKKTIKNDFDPKQYRVKGIYGENGSGKTAIMTAVRIMTRIILDRNYLSDSVNQRLLLENINKKTGKATLETEFYAQGTVGPFIYHYRADLEIRGDERVYLAKEILERKIGHNSQGQYIIAFETENGELISFGKDELLTFSKTRSQNLLEQRSFATFVNLIEEANLHHISNDWQHMLALATFAANLYVWIDGEDDHRADIAGRLLQEKDQGKMREAADMTILSWASTFSQDRKERIIPRSQLPLYILEVRKLYSFIRIFKTDLKDIRVDKKEYGEDFYLCRLIMVYDGYELDREYESRGIRKLMNLYDALDAACKGNIVFIDELDSNINDIYLDKLVEYFVYYGKGQLCFTAHNLSPMSVLRNSKCAISFISAENTVHTWTSNGNQNPEHAYRDGFIEDSPFNVDSSDFLGVLGGSDE